MAEPLVLLPIQKALEILGPLSKTWFYDAVKAGLMPPPIRFGQRCSRLLKSEIEALARAHIANATDDQIRLLVKELVERREALMPALRQEAEAA